jgi:hypothetical protein
MQLLTNTICKGNNMSMHKSIIGQTVGGASVKTDTGSFDRYPYMKHSTAEQTLGDYVARKIQHEGLQAVSVEQQRKKFEEWYNGQRHNEPWNLPHIERMWQCWATAQGRSSEEIFAETQKHV